MKKQNGGIVFDRRGWIRITSAEIVLFCHAIKAGKVCGTSAYISAAWLSVAMQLSWLSATNALNLLMRCSAEETGRPRLKIPVSAPWPGANAVAGLGVGMPNHPD